MKILNKIFSDEFVIISFLSTLILSILKLSKIIKLNWLIIFSPVYRLIILLIFGIIGIVISSIIEIYFYKK
jgi:hypothetical protein